MGSSTTTPSSIDGVLDIALHHANNIHNICIYGDQDVYAKFSITHTQYAVYSTQPVRGGGKNPVFNQSLQILIPKLDAVLKCEIWMMSCVRTYLEDQLLGFVLIPLCDLFGQGCVTKDYSLSSSELFHTPAGIVRLSLTFYARGADIPLGAALLNSSSVCAPNGLNSREENGTHEARDNEMRARVADNTHDVVMNANQGMLPMEYDNIEFPDLRDACENYHLVSAYVEMASGMDANMDEGGCGEADQCSVLKGEEKAHDGPGSPRHSSILEEDVTGVLSEANKVQFLDSSTSTLSVEVSTQSAQESLSFQDASLSSTRRMSRGGPSAQPVFGHSADRPGSEESFSAPRVTISLEPDEPVVQQQIVDMYMKSMQQFSESVAKMKLPLDLENTHSQVEVTNESQVQNEKPTSKDGHRVLYGSRAFF